jgi:hypothetical protein
MLCSPNHLNTGFALGLTVSNSVLQCFQCWYDKHEYGAYLDVPTTVLLHTEVVLSSNLELGWNHFQCHEGHVVISNQHDRYGQSWGNVSAFHSVLRC